MQPEKATCKKKNVMQNYSIEIRSGIFFISININEINSYFQKDFPIKQTTSYKYICLFSIHDKWLKQSNSERLKIKE